MRVNDSREYCSNVEAAELPSQADKPAGTTARRRALYARVTSAAVRSCHCLVVVAAAVPLSGAGA